MSTNLNLVRRLALGIQKTAAMEAPNVVEADRAQTAAALHGDVAEHQYNLRNPNYGVVDQGGKPIGGGMVTPAKYGWKEPVVAPKPAPAPASAPAANTNALGDLLIRGLGETGAAVGRGAAAMGGRLIQNYTDPRFLKVIDENSPAVRAASTLAETANAAQNVANAGAATDRYNERAAQTGRPAVTKDDIGSNMDVPRQVVGAGLQSAGQTMAEGARRTLANNPIVAQQRMAQQAGRKIGDTGVALGRRLMNWMDRAYGGTGR